MRCYSTFWIADQSRSEAVQMSYVLRAARCRASRRTCEIASHDCLTLQDLALLDEHGPAVEVLPVLLPPLLDASWHLVEVIGDEVVLQYRPQSLKPELAESGEELALVGDALFRGDGEGSKRSNRKQQGGRKLTVSVSNPIRSLSGCALLPPSELAMPLVEKLFRHLVLKHRQHPPSH